MLDKIDQEILPVIEHLNDLGYETINSCRGRYTELGMKDQRTRDGRHSITAYVMFTKKSYLKRMDDIAKSCGLMIEGGDTIRPYIEGNLWKSSDDIVTKSNIEFPYNVMKMFTIMGKAKNKKGARCSSKNS